MCLFACKDIQMYPAVAAAVIPVVHIPEIDHASDALTLPGQVLADIFLGNVTRYVRVAVRARVSTSYACQLCAAPVLAAYAGFELLL